MREHHTKSKGDLGVLKAQVSLYEQGYLPLLPQTEHANFDLVGYKDGDFRRVQVKYRSVTARGNIEISFRSYWADKNGNHASEMDKSEVDLVCVYCPKTDLCYWFDPSKFNKAVTLRVDSPKNNQKANINLASKFLRVP